jgi:hypothetical protein
LAGGDSLATKPLALWEYYTMSERNHQKYYFYLRNNSLAYVLDVIAQDLQVYETFFLENTVNKLIGNQRLINKKYSLKSLGKLIISISSPALSFNCYALY